MSMDPDEAAFYDELFPGTAEFAVEEILDHSAKNLFHVRWKGFTEEEDTWEPLEHVYQCQSFRTYLTQIDPLYQMKIENALEDMQKKLKIRKQNTKKKKTKRRKSTSAINTSTKRRKTTNRRRKSTSNSTSNKNKKPTVKKSQKKPKKTKKTSQKVNNEPESDDESSVSSEYDSSPSPPIPDFTEVQRYLILPKKDSEAACNSSEENAEEESDTDADEIDCNSQLYKLISKLSPKSKQKFIDIMQVAIDTDNNVCDSCGNKRKFNDKLPATKRQRRK